MVISQSNMLEAFLCFIGSVLFYHNFPFDMYFVIKLLEKIRSLVSSLGSTCFRSPGAEGCENQRLKKGGLLNALIFFRFNEVNSLKIQRIACRR